MYHAEYYRWLVARRYLSIRGGRLSLLDAGCHDGFFLLHETARLRVGLDLHPVPRYGLAVLLVQADLLRPPFRPASFETIFCFDVLEHIVEDERLLAVLMALLAPGGTLWLSTPCREMRIFPGLLMPRLHRGSGHVRQGYTEEELRRKLPGCAIEVTEWNEPFLRAAYVPLHLLSLAWPWLAQRAAACCAWLDHFFPAGRRGHLFLRVRPSP